MKLEGRYLTTEEAAQALGITQARIRQLILDGTLSAIKLGHEQYGTWLVPEAEIEKYKQTRRKRGRPSKNEQGGGKEQDG
jgi:excisionase family DNA binding protein